MSDTVTVVTDVPAPSFLKRLPLKHIALTTTLVVASVLVAKFVTDRSDVDVSVTDASA